MRKEDLQRLPDVATEVSVDQIIRPFSQHTGFLEKDLSGTEEGDRVLILAHRFKFQGIEGALSLIAEDISRMINVETETPLGPAVFRKELHGSEYTLKETPILLELDFIVSNYSDVEKLGAYRTSLQIGEKGFEIECKGEVAEDRDEVEATIDEFGECMIWNYEFVGKGGNMIRIYLPRDLDKLKTVTMEFSRKDDK